MITCNFEGGECDEVGEAPIASNDGGEQRKLLKGEGNEGWQTVLH